MRRRFVIEFDAFDNLTKQHVDMLLSTFEIKDVSYNYVQKLRQSTPFIDQLLPWDLIWTVLSNITNPKTVRFGALNQALTRRDLEGLQDRARDLSKLYAPIRFVVFEFDPNVNAQALAQALSAVSARSINRRRPSERPPVAATKLEPLPAKPPAIPDIGAIRAATQAFMLPPKEGIGAYDVWNNTGVKGYDVRYVDIEYGWEIYHPDLPTIRDPYDGTYSYKSNDPGNRDHGTGMLGIISAQHNSIGSYGIAPEAEAYVLSQLRGPNLVNLPGAIELACTRILRPGDVLLIEAQTTRGNGDYMPVELEREVFAAIELGVTLGVTIIEPAGNSGVNLNLTSRFQKNAPNSGAILVAASQSSAPNIFEQWVGMVPNSSTNFGNRVDCFAWGDLLGTLTSDLKAVYKKGQGGTSAASAIIAGAAILAQSLYKAQADDNSAIWPDELRSLLSDPSGTKSKGGEKIGVMPDLSKISANLPKAATIPPKVKAPQSLLDALFESDASTNARRSSAPRLATFGSCVPMPS